MGAYSGAFRKLLLKFKYGGGESLDTLLVPALSQRVAQADYYETVDAVVAVPSCWRRRLRRPFHPADLLARQLGRRLGMPVAPVLVRLGGGPHQAGLTWTARAQNVRGRFRMARGCRVRGARLLLVDDVMTSGATVGECARVLKGAGAAEVNVAILARAADDPLSLARV